MKFTSYGALALVLLLGFAGVWKLQKRIDAQRQAVEIEDDQVLLRSTKLVKALSLEYAPMVADIYWTRAVQYFGNKHHLHQMDLRLLWPLLDLTSTLDPNLLPVYHFGSTFLSDAPPRGMGRPDLAVQLIERGLRANPEDWRLYYDLGYVYYFDKKDYAKASAAFYEGSKNPNAYYWMKVMAAKIAAEGDSLETSMFLWQDVYNNTKDERVRENALTHLQLLRAKEDCKQIDALADDYEKRLGRRPTRIRELVQAGLLKGVPVDALGYAYTLSEDGKAELNVESPLLEKQVLVEPKK
jgi:tetratricopeptide (TPR) repeat protein